MEKLLTISIAAYNVEKFIRQTLDSLMIPEIINDLEIFVIDDGGQDNTLSIAEEYAQKYPDSVFPIHKENGGYGTVFNCAINLASGKYFKLLDGDDWFDKEGLISLISILRKTDADVLITNFYKGPDPENLHIRRTAPSAERAVCDISDLKIVFPVGMWSLVYKTEILRKVGLSLPGKTLYTDQYYCTIPFSEVKTVELCPISVYCYRIGNEEQSSSRISRIKHTDEMLKICRDLSVFAESCKGKDSFDYILLRASVYHLFALKTILLDDVNSENRVKLIKYDKQILEAAPAVYEKAGRVGSWGKVISIMRTFNYMPYWLIKLIPGGVPNWQ